MSDALFTEFSPFISFLDTGFTSKYTINNAPESTFAETDHDEWEGKIAQSYEAGFAAGREEALRQSETLHQQESGLAKAIAALRCADQEKLSQLFWQSTLSLIKKTIGETPVDEALLLERCRAVMALIDKQVEQSQLYVAPDDFTIVQQFSCNSEIIADPELLSGSVRFVHAHGIINAGSTVILSAIEDAIAGAGQSPC